MVTDESIQVTDEELKEAEEELSADVYVHSFKQAFTWEGQVYGQLTFDFGKLTGDDVLAIESELSRMRHVSVIPQYDTEFKLRVAVRACDAEIGIDAFRAMKMRDFMRIMGRVQGFFATTD